MQDEIIEGRFWLPGDPHKGYGRLEFSLEDGPRLHLVDCNLIGEDGRPQPAPLPALHGETLGGQPLTLLDVYPTKWTTHGWGTGAGNTMEAFASRLLRGTHIADESELEATAFGLSVHGLRAFLTGASVERGVLPVPAEPHKPNSLNVELGGGVSCLFSVMTQPHFGRDRHETGSKTVVSTHWSCSSALPLAAFERDYLQPLQDLILFATRQQSYVTALSAARVASDPSRVEVLQQAFPRPRESEEPYSLALNLADHEDPAGLVVGWYQLQRKVGPVWALFFSTLGHPESLLEDQLLGLLSFAEGYHRAVSGDPSPLSEEEHKEAVKAVKDALRNKRVRSVYSAAIKYANAPTQAERLRSLIDRALSALSGWDLDAERFCKQLSHTRNWLVHWGDKGKHAVEDPGGRVMLVRQLTVVIYANILFELGLTEDAVARSIGSGWRLENLFERSID